MCVTSHLMRRIGLVVMAVVLATTSVAGAQSRRAVANQPAKAARVKPPASKPTVPAPRPVKQPIAKAALPAKAIVAPSDADESTIDNPKPLPIPANALMMQYQRVGRDLLLLNKERAAQEGADKIDAKVSCSEMQTTFRSIKLEEALATPESRAAAAAVLAELHAKIVRMRGIELSQECLNNPLAKDCT